MHRDRYLALCTDFGPDGPLLGKGLGLSRQVFLVLNPLALGKLPQQLEGIGGGIDDQRIINAIAKNAVSVQRSVPLFMPASTLSKTVAPYETSEGHCWHRKCTNITTAFCVARRIPRSAPMPAMDSKPGPNEGMGGEVDESTSGIRSRSTGIFTQWLTAAIGLKNGTGAHTDAMLGACCWASWGTACPPAP